MSRIEVPFNFEPRPYQQELFKALDSGFKRAILTWSRRAGKDKACWCHTVRSAVQTTGNYFYIFPNGTDARRALWENNDRDGFPLLQHLPNELVQSRNEQEMRLTLFNNSVIRFVGIEDADKLRGTSAKGVVFSEFAYQNPVGYKVIMPSIRESNGWAIFNSTPNGQNHYFEFRQRILANQKKGKSKEWFLSTVQTYFQDKPTYHPLLSRDDLDMERDDNGFTENEMAREYGCSFESSVEGAIYGHLIAKARTEGRVGDFLHDETLPVYTFWDLGKSDSTAIWFTQKKDDKVFFIDYEEANGQNIDYYAALLRNKGYDYEAHFLPHDGAHDTAVADMSYQNKLRMLLSNFGLKDDVMVAKRLKVAQGIDAVRSRFNRYHFDLRCSEGLKKLEQYHYKFDKSRQCFLKEPVHDSSSHCADALRTEAITAQDHDYRINDYDEELNIISHFEVF